MSQDSTPRALPRSARAPLAVLALLGIGALLVPALASTDPQRIGDVLTLRYVPPLHSDAQGAFHVLGTDKFGRDIFVRTMLAARVSLLIGVLGSLLAGALGILVGAVSGWRGGAIDRALMALSDGLLAIPRVVLLLVCAALWQPGGMTVLLVLVATGWMTIARLVRAEVLGLRTRPFVEAAGALGARPARLLWKHVLPNATGPAVVAMTLGVGGAILLESGLSFLGLGVQPPRPSWGNMIADGREAIVTAPWIALTPGLALVATVVACTLLGDAVRDPRSGAGREALRDRS